MSLIIKLVFDKSLYYQYNYSLDHKLRTKDKNT